MSEESDRNDRTLDLRMNRELVLEALYRTHEAIAQVHRDTIELLMLDEGGDDFDDDLREV